MELFDTPQKDQMAKGQIEVLDNKQHEFKLIGHLRRVKGHTLFSFNTRTGEVKAADIERSKVCDFATQMPTYNYRLVIEPDCIYRQALNSRNFLKRLVREGILIKRTK